jgi:hypothetical protein
MFRVLQVFEKEEKEESVESQTPLPHCRNFLAVEHLVWDSSATKQKPNKGKKNSIYQGMREGNRR